MREPDEGTDDLDPLAGGGATRRSIWPAIYPELLELVQSHKSTIVFVNNRRGAERLAMRLNELAGEDGKPADIARAHHGSLAREERLIVEEMLKSGELPCLVATSSLELGIDMGAVDLVLQVESPKSVTRGLQRIGRAGHGVGETSKGRIFPKFRSDLLESAVVAQRMREALIEETVVPRNPLDVLAQQIVACVAVGDDWKVPELHEHGAARVPVRRARRASCSTTCSTCSTGATRPRSSPSCGRGSSGTASQDVVRARQGARQLAITNAGTIPDRGLFGVHLPDGRRVGELDEEMVYEARPGQTFMLGASTWRIEEITRDRVLVTPAPGAPGRSRSGAATWSGRPAELGKALGEFARTAVDKEPGERREGVRPRRARREEPRRLPARAARGDARGAQRPDDRRRALPRRDRRLAAVRPLPVRRPRARGVGARARAPGSATSSGSRPTRSGRTTGSSCTSPTPTSRPEPELVMVEPDEVEDLVVRELGNSALFGARFRENAARALLLLPRAYPGKRTPLWQQRLKAQSLLEVAKRYGQFPIVLETYRECLQDVFDLPALKDLLRGLHTRELSLVEVETPRSSPFASSLLFDYVATYMYEGDTPNAERRAAALSLDRELLARAARPGGAARPDRPGRARRGRGRPPAPLRAHPGGERRRRCTTSSARSATSPSTRCRRAATAAVSAKRILDGLVRGAPRGDDADRR